MNFPISLIAYALAASATNGGKPLGAEAIRARVESMAVLDVPCSYRLETRLFFLQISELEEGTFADTVTRLRSVSDEPVQSLAEVWDLFEARARLSEQAEEVVWHRTSRVACSPGFRVQNQIEPAHSGILGSYRKGHVDIYVVAHPLGDVDANVPNQIVAQVPSASPPIDDMVHLMRPLPIQREILAGWETCAWTRSFVAGSERNVVHPRSAEGGHVLEFDPVDGLPQRAAMFFEDPDQPSSQASFVGLYEFGTAGEESWLCRALHLSIDPESITIEMSRLDDVAFEIDPSDQKLHATPHCVLFDYRSGQENYFGTARSEWPLDVRMALGEELHPAPALAAVPTPGGGYSFSGTVVAVGMAVLLLLGSAAAFGLHRSPRSP